MFPGILPHALTHKIGPPAAWVSVVVEDGSRLAEYPYVTLSLGGIKPECDLLTWCSTEDEAWCYFYQALRSHVYEQVGDSQVSKASVYWRTLPRLHTEYCHLRRALKFTVTARLAVVREERY